MSDEDNDADEHARSAGLLDVKKLATEVASKAIDRLLKSGESAVRTFWASQKNQDVRSYTTYYINTASKAGSVRNFVYDRRSAYLYDIYVPLRLEGGSSDNELFQSIIDPDDPRMTRPTGASVITGGAGMGKSLLMRHAFFKLPELDPRRIPILLELRSFNRTTLGSLEEKLFEAIAAAGAPIMREQVTHGLKTGLFTLLLDGLDELKGAIQTHYESEILRVVQQYIMCPVLISSRPMSSVKSWQLIDSKTISPLSKRSALDMVSRLEFDSSVKQLFCDDIKRDLFSSHYEFVSNPLLCTVMLLTFSDSGRISRDRPEFFEDAFTALWSKHDDRKEGRLKRHRYTKFSKKDFQRLLGAFALSSYRFGDYEMRENQVAGHLDMAMKLTSLHCSLDDFVNDFIRTTSLGFEDGPFISFIHRSLQEYFAATFASQVPDANAGRLIEDLSDRIETDSVLPMILAIQPEKIEKNWVLPLLRRLDDIVAPRLDISLYATSAASNSNMQKIRKLYGRDNSAVLAAFDAARGMDLLDVLSEDADLSEHFERDRRWFNELRKTLERSHGDRGSALEELVAGRLTLQ